MKFLNSFLIDDPYLLGRRLALYTGLRATLWAFLTWDPLSGFWALWPNPIIPLYRAIYWNNINAFGVNLFNFTDFILVMNQILLIMGLAVWTISRYQPALIDKIPALATSNVNAPLDGPGLRRWKYKTPFLLSLVIFLTFYGIGAFFLASSASPYRYSGPPYAMLFEVGWWPLLVGGIFVVTGWLGGLQSVLQAKASVESDFGVRWLPPEHELAQRVHRYAELIDLPPPRVGVINAVNAFAMGSSAKNAAVVLGVPLIQHLQEDELDAVIGHELGHVVSGDMVQMQYSDGFQKAFGWFIKYIVGLVTFAGAAMSGMNSKNGGASKLAIMVGDAFGEIFSAIGNFAGVLMVKALSRKREYYADAVGAGLTSPDAMQRALARLGEIPANSSPPEDKYAYLMFRPMNLQLFLATHPSTDRRIASLQQGAYTRRLPRKGS